MEMIGSEPCAMSMLCEEFLSVFIHKIVTGLLFVYVNGKPLRLTQQLNHSSQVIGKLSFLICVTAVEAIPQCGADTHSSISHLIAFHVMACLLFHYVYHLI